MPETELPRPTDAELEILNVLWRRGPSTVREVFETLGETRGTGYTTVLKLSTERASAEELSEIRQMLDKLERRKRR
jgi:hypothetical protein